MGYTDSRVVLDNMDLLGQVSVESYIIFMGTLIPRLSPFLEIDN